jgi:putative membrane-bound dehydrogenase-like protein
MVTGAVHIAKGQTMNGTEAFARVSATVLLTVCCVACPRASRAQEPIPHGQSAPPGPPLSPAEALQKMTVPPGFQVELVASEPDIVNPVAMTFDERGRIWITESLEYPRSDPGPGRDRIKVLEDTDGDGKADRFTVFADGFNIPSGIAVGYGGVWVANSPDILFLKDVDGDGKADSREVVVSGFGRSDTHELPNSLTWGPDGWLYGWNGVFNQSRVTHRGKTYKFTCAIFRINPRTRDFELFCEGTSNPWGIAWDTEGSAFASACVIDHLWHLTETGYYHRQGGAYPAFTWKLGSIVSHNHQKAAYCGIHFFDSDAYPLEYRERLFMGNIHGNCINVDRLSRQGSTYRALPEPDFLSAHDAWFMPVSQKTGPDGCLYVLDWYDRYHCYQDARRDPQGIDRLKGRLYRVRYQDTPRAGQFDLAQESGDRLIERLRSPNVYFRDIAQRLLAERDAGATRPKLQSLVLDNAAARKARMHALWALIGTGRIDPEFHRQLLANSDPGIRAWGVRAAGNFGTDDRSIRAAVVALARDPEPDVALQVAIAAPKLPGVDPVAVLVDVLAHCGDDALTPHICWENLHPLLENQGDAFVRLAEQTDLAKAGPLTDLLPRALDRLLGAQTFDPTTVARLLRVALRSGSESAADQAIAMVSEKIAHDEITADRLPALSRQLSDVVSPLRAELPDGPLAERLTVLSALWKDPRGLEAARRLFAASSTPPATRLRALEALIFTHDANLFESVSRAITDRTGSLEDRGKLLAAMGRLEEPRIAAVVLDTYPNMEPELQPRAIELLTERAAWSKQLLQAIALKRLPPNAVNLNQVRKLLRGRDRELADQVRKQWGTLREERNPAREQVITRLRTVLREQPGDPAQGEQVFKKVCAQCHKLYGDGQDIGPDLTNNGRNDFEQLLSNVLDPSLVIGASYQATIVSTSDGRVLTGLLVEETPERVVLKTQGGMLEIVPRAELEEVKRSTLSLMPEDLENQLSPQELVDLFAFLVLDKHPSDPSAKRLPGAPALKTRSSTERN